MANEQDLVGEALTELTEGRRSKRARAPTRSERTKQLHDRVLNLVEELESAGFAPFMPPPGPITLLGPEVNDPKTQGKIGHVQEPLGMYIRRVSVRENFFQRPPFDHVTDPIYRRLIRDFIEGAAIPETKIAALSATVGRVSSLDEAGIKFSVIDGLQRLYCFLLALLLVWRRDQLVRDGFIPQESWNFFMLSVNECGVPTAATEKLLQRLIRFEIFYGINLANLLHYMVTFNTGQRRMSLPLQLEIMKKPLIEQLKSEGIPIWEDMGRMPGERRPREKFLASDLVLATQAFVTNNAYVTAGNEADRFLNENQPYLDNVADVSDVITVLKRITITVHPKVLEVYAADRGKRYIISAERSFLVGLMAACGYVRNRSDIYVLDRVLDKLMDRLNRPVEDPLDLQSYEKALFMLRDSRGQSVRRLVDDTFRRFFLGVTTQLEWLDTFSQISGTESTGKNLSWQANDWTQRGSKRPRSFYQTG